MRCLSIDQENEMSKRPPGTKISTKTSSSVSSKASSSSKTTSSGSTNRSVSKSRPVGKSPVPKSVKKADQTVADKKSDKKQPTDAKTDDKTDKTESASNEINKIDVKIDKTSDQNEKKDVNNNQIVTELKIDDTISPVSSPIPVTKDELINQNLDISQVPLKSGDSADESSDDRAKSQKSVKRKPSTMQHRNSKQDTAQLLRRKSLTPSMKLILLCKKGDWLAVETFLKQVDKKSIDNSIISEDNNWTPLHFAGCLLFYNLIFIE